jgi:tetratricopeptide (TPR) repeat protein
MYAEKFELLEAKIRETAMLVSRLREEKQQLEWENEHLRARVAELEAQLQGVAGPGQQYEPELDHLLEQLETLQQDDAPPPRHLPAPGPTQQEPAPRDSAALEEHVQRGILHEQQGEYEPAIQAYQQALEVDSDNLDAAQRLAFLLEKLNRDAEAAALWDKIWAMRGPQTPPRRRRLR